MIQIERLIELKDFVNTLASTNSALRLTDAEWKKIDEIRDVFKDCYYFTKKSQSEQVTLSDFYACWTEMKFKLKNKPNSELVDNLICYMDEREIELLQSPVVLAALFLDARYRVLLKDIPLATQTAINHLANLWKRLCDLQRAHNVNLQQENNNDSENQCATDVNVMNFENYLDSLESSQAVTSTNRTNIDEIMTKLTLFDTKMNSKKRESTKKHAMDF